jgi:uncharacterized protein YycO
MLLCYSKSKKPIVRLLTMNHFTHCGVVDGTHIIHASMRNGVEKIPLEEYAELFCEHDYIKLPLTLNMEERAMNFLYNQLGKKYDYLALPGLFFHRNWQAEDQWFCSELLEASLVAAGLKRFRAKSHTITPQQSWSVC